MLFGCMLKAVDDKCSTMSVIYLTQVVIAMMQCYVLCHAQHSMLFRSELVPIGNAAYQRIKFKNDLLGLGVA